MPFESEAQRRFMYAKHPELAKEFEKATPKGADLPEHVKKMAEGGVTAGNPSELDPGIKDATVSDFLLPYLLGPSMAKAGAEDVLPALEGLGERGEISLGGSKGLPSAADRLDFSNLARNSYKTLGGETKEALTAAPAMEEAANPEEVTAFVKGIQKGAPGSEGVKIYGVKGSPAKLKELFGDEAPGSVPENILREKGILPPQVSVPGQAAPNAYADGGVIENAKKEKTDAQKADDIDPVVSSSTPTPKGYADGGYPHVTFMEDETPAEVKKTTHMASAPKMAEGGTIHKAEDRNKEPAKPANVEVSHEKKMKAIYKAMGIKQYADGGTVDGGDVDASQLPTPNSTDPTFWDQIKSALAKVGNSPAGTIAGMAMNPVSGIASAAEGAAPAILKAEGPAVSGIANTMSGGALPAIPPTAPAVAPTASPAVPPAPPAPAVAPVIPAAKAPAEPSDMPNIAGIFNQDTSKLTAGVNPEDRQAVIDKLQSQQHGLGAIIAQAVSGLGDAIAAKGGREQHSLHDIFSMQKQQRDESLANFDKARQDRIQKLQLQTQMGDNALKQAAAADAYGVDEHLNGLLGAPKGTMKKDLPTYMGILSSQIAAKEKDEDLYMKSHAQAGTDVDNAIKNSSILGIKPSPAQLQASGAKLADQYYNRAKGNVLVKPSDGGQAQWIPAQNIGKAKQMDPNLTVQQ